MAAVWGRDERWGTQSGGNSGRPHVITRTGIDGAPAPIAPLQSQLRAVTSSDESLVNHKLLLSRTSLIRHGGEKWNTDVFTQKALETLESYLLLKEKGRVHFHAGKEAKGPEHRAWLDLSLIETTFPGCSPSWRWVSTFPFQGCVDGLSTHVAAASAVAPDTQSRPNTRAG